MFKNRWCIISPPKDADAQSIKILKSFWEAVGSKVKIMTPEEHDEILSLTSHLPHAIAYNIVRTVINVEDKLKQEVIQYSAGGLRDFTRIASSNPLMWRDIFLDNNENISKGIDNFIEKLQELKKALGDKNADKLYQIFNSTKEIRKEIIKAGQDTSKPDFGRKKD
jgi:cyclohexadieny/prephenate dehydrogenase